MKIEKRNNHKKKIVIGGMIVTSALVVGILATSYAKYRVTESIKLGEGIINYTGADFEVVEMYLINKDGTETEIDTVPGAGYIINTEKTKCTVNDSEVAASIECKDNKLYFGDITEKGTKCKVYFEKKANAGDTILGNTTAKPGTDSFTGPATTVADSGLFSTQDDDGTTYYYRGIVNNNWVEFAGLKWRIIRINGDKSIRLIYNGTTTEQTGEGTQIGTQKYNNNSSNRDGASIGFKHTTGELRGTNIPSLVLGADNSTDTKTLNGWYNTKLKNTKYEQYIDKNAGFCNDREPDKITDSLYSYHIDFKYTTRGSNNPTFKCSNEDLFTSTMANKGNKSLANPIGLITADEASYAGGFGGTENKVYWIYTGQRYWTMTAGQYNISSAGSNVLQINAYGKITHTSITDSWGVRPVINLRSDIELTGTGTTTDPYKIVE